MEVKYILAILTNKSVNEVIQYHVTTINALNYEISQGPASSRDLVYQRFRDALSHPKLNASCRHDKTDCAQAVPIHPMLPHVDESDG